MDQFLALVFFTVLIASAVAIWIRSWWLTIIVPGRRRRRLKRLAAVAGTVAPQDLRDEQGQIISWRLDFPDLITLHADFIAGVLSVEAHEAKWTPEEDCSWQGEHRFEMPLKINTYLDAVTNLVNYAGGYESGATIDAAGVNIGPMGGPAKWIAGPEPFATRTGFYDATLKIRQDKPTEPSSTPEKTIGVRIEMPGLPGNAAFALEKCLKALQLEISTRVKKP